METAHRYSKKREAILEAMRGTLEHPSAEWIYAKLKPEFPDLSLGTVYRNLAFFRDGGDIMSVGTVCGVERFDADTHPHTHFVCTCCGSVIDVEDDPGESFSRVENRTGGRVAARQLTYFGQCAECLEKNKN